MSPHPDSLFKNWLFDGLAHGFRIGFDRSSRLVAATQNLPSATLQESVVSEYIRKEVGLGHFTGPLPEAGIHVSPVGVIPKGHTPGKWRVITDLSSPAGGSVNDGIDPHVCSMTYITVDAVARMVNKLGGGALLAKIDIEAAYRLIPVHPLDRPLLGVKWEGKVYCDCMLPFGLRSAPKIFNALADSLEWIIRRKGVAYTAHYLDDYVIVGPPGTSRCADDLHTLVETCEELGVPLAVAKCEGPTPCLTFLGIQIDTVKGTLSLPKDKLERVQSMVQQWEGRKACSRRELESLIGLLNHACKVVQPGRSFLRRMLDLLSGSAGRGSHRRRGGFVRLNRAFQADLAWWRAFLQDWNGVGFMSSCAQPTAMVELVSDASGSWGCGAFWGSRWLQVQWDESAVRLPIAAKELFPIILGAAIWGGQWKGLVVTCRCDNQAVVSTLLSRTSREEHMMHMLRCLFYIEAAFNFQLRCHHIPGVQNTAADALSRNNADLFFAQVPLANPAPDNPPDQLVRSLLSPDLDWLSQAWTKTFVSSSRRASQSQPIARTQLE